MENMMRYATEKKTLCYAVPIGTTPEINIIVIRLGNFRSRMSSKNLRIKHRLCRLNILTRNSNSSILCTGELAYFEVLSPRYRITT